MADQPEMPTVRIAPVEMDQGVLALGCWAFGGRQWGGQDDADSAAAMAESLRRGVNHFDTAEAYGRGRSEEVVGRFLHDRRDEVFVATKAFPPREIAKQVFLDKLDHSLQRLGTDVIDLYYLHWPRKGQDMRPAMEALVEARQQGKIRAIGVSNFPVEQMEQVSQVGRIDAHQLCYNLFWRFQEKEVIPYCVEHGIAVVTYSSIAQGILTGKFPRDVVFGDNDQRRGMVHFDAEVWPHVYDGVEKLKALASEAARPLTHLAIRWVARQPGVTSVIVGARNTAQAAENAAAMAGAIDDSVFDRMDAVSAEVNQHVPDAGNIFRFYP